MAKNLKVEDYEGLALKTTGLVPMKFLKGTITDKVGDVAGFEPYTAKRMHDDGLAEPVGDVKASASTVTKAAGPSDDDKRRSAVEIPGEWEGEHHLQRIALAKKIAGSDDNLNADRADEIIRAEIERRAGAK